MYWFSKRDLFTSKNTYSVSQSESNAEPLLKDFILSSPEPPIDDVVNGMPVYRTYLMPNETARIQIIKEI